MRKKKNRFLLFIASCLPGCGEMYLGFMKRGVSLLTLFVLGMMVAMITNLGVLAMIPMILWAYSFFESNNLGALDDEQFYTVEDKYMFGLDAVEIDSMKNSIMGKYRKVVAIALVLLGLNLLWNEICDILYSIFRTFGVSDILYQMVYHIGNSVTRIAIGIAIIWIGIRLVKGKKVELEESEKTEYVNPAEVVIEARSIEVNKEEKAGEVGDGK